MHGEKLVDANNNELFSKSSKPQAALDEISKTMNIRTSINNKLEFLRQLKPIVQEVALKSTNTQVIGGRGMVEVEKAIRDYLRYPSKETFTGIDKSTGTMVEEINDIVKNFESYL